MCLIRCWDCARSSRARRGNFLTEHMRHSNPMIGTVMDVLTLLVHLMGPDINRRTLDNVRAAGLECEHVEELGMGGISTLIVAECPTAIRRRRTNRQGVSHAVWSNPHHLALASWKSSTLVRVTYVLLRNDPSPCNILIRNDSSPYNVPTGTDPSPCNILIRYV